MITRLAFAGAFASAILLSVSAFSQWTWTPETGRFINMGNLPKETAELQVEYTRSLVVAGDFSVAMTETEKFTQFYGDTEYADDNQFLRGQILLEQDDYVKAAEEFQQLISVYPESPLYDEVIESQYTIGDSLYEKGLKRAGSDDDEKGWQPLKSLQKVNPFRHRPLKKAIDVYTMVINNQPFTAAAAEAQYKIGLCHFTREEYLEASFEFRRVMEDYRDSDWVRESTFYLTRSYEEAALDPDYDQAPSKLAIGAIEDFSRRYPDDERVAQRQEVSAEMNERIAEQRYRTARYYQKRRNMDSARIYYEITAHEFEGTAAAAKAAEWLAANPPSERAHPSFVGSPVGE